MRNGAQTEGGGDTVGHCKVGRAGNMQQSVQRPRGGARERGSWVVSVDVRAGASVRLNVQRASVYECECECVSVFGCEWAARVADAQPGGQTDRQIAYGRVVVVAFDRRQISRANERQLPIGNKEDRVYR